MFAIIFSEETEEINFFAEYLTNPDSVQGNLMRLMTKNDEVSYRSHRHGGRNFHDFVRFRMFCTSSALLGSVRS